MDQAKLEHPRTPQRPVLTRLGWNESRESQFDRLDLPGLEPARIIRVDRGLSLAQTEHDVVRCTQGLRETTATVGDWVALEQIPDVEHLRIAEVLPRTSSLERSGGEYGVQTLAANVDYVLIVQPCDRMDIRRMERELAQVSASGATPVVVLSKSDMVLDLPAVVDQARRVSRDVTVLPISVVMGEGMDAVESLFVEPMTAALIGASGAGKSTLANALLGEDVMATTEVRGSDLKGRHTTTARHLLPLPSGGALVDTPGMREFGLTGDFSGVEAVFSDISETASNCRFRDCRHRGEPGCAVSNAIDSGDLDEDRLTSYRKLEREQEAWRAKNDPLLRKQRTQVWKNRTRSMRQRKHFGGKWE